MLFFRRLAQYLSSLSSSGTNCFLDFLIIGCGFSSSSEKARVRGSKSRPDEANENAAKIVEHQSIDYDTMNHVSQSHSLDSAGDGGLIVSGLTQSDGDGERSRFVVM